MHTHRLLAVLLLTTLAAPAAWAAEPPDGPPPIAPETIGNWRFREASRPIKAVVIGGSVTGWPRGGFAQFLEAACPRVEIVNKGKARIGAVTLKTRFIKQVLRNRRITPREYEEMWLIFQGGLNSLSTPHITNKAVRDIFRKAHRAGIKVLGLTIGPWGSKSRWSANRSGLRTEHRTLLLVDFVLGKLTPQQALGNYARDRDGAGWEAEELPDVAVDLYRSDLRDKDAALLSDKAAAGYLTRDRWVRKVLEELEGTEREQAEARFIKRAKELPRWWMRKELQAFDAVHPHLEGHRIIAQKICPEVPASWGCKCDAMAKMKWSKRKPYGLQPQVK